MAGQFNFPEFKESFFEALDPDKTYNPTAIKKIFEKAEFQNQSEYDSRCKDCGTQFNVSDFNECPDCGSRSIERNF